MSEQKMSGQPLAKIETIKSIGANARPIKARANEDLPAALGPITPNTSPALSAKETFCRDGCLDPGGKSSAPSTDSAPLGVGKDMGLSFSGNSFNSSSNLP